MSPVGLRRSGRIAAIGLVIASAALAAAQRATTPAVTSALIDAPQLLQDLRTLSADDMQGRQVGTAGGEKARAYVVSRFKASGITPFGQDYAQPFAIDDRSRPGAPARQGVNVVGYLDGRGQSRRYIVVSAHYDHVGIRNGQVFNGANDNASGTAALFALAAYFRQHPPANPIIFAAFDGEEAGLLGSRAFVKAPPVDRAALALNVNADMLGRDPSQILFAAGATRQPFLTPYIARVAAKAPVKLVMGHDDRRQGADDWTADSDQYAFLEADIPALYVGVDDAGQHHRPTDDYETIMYRFYVGAVETVLQLVQEFDQHLDEIR